MSAGLAPSEAYTEAHERVMRCAETLTVLSLAIDGNMIGMDREHRDGLATVLQRALDDARAARECFLHIPRPKDPL